MFLLVDPSYSDQLFIVDGYQVYTLDRGDERKVLRLIAENNWPELSKHQFCMNQLYPEEQHFKVMFDTAHKPLTRLLFGE